MRHHAFALSILLILLLAACRPIAGDRPPRLVLVPPTPTLRPPTSTITTTLTLPLPTPQPQRSPTPNPAALATQAAESAAWLANAALGPYAPTGEPWEEVERRARAEGYVTLYADSARAVAAVESFMRAYPGLEAEAQASGSYDTYLRLAEDLQTNKRVADLYLVSDAPRTLALLDQAQLWSYLPPDLAPVLPQGMREPLLVHHWTALMLICSPVLSQTRPIESWWDLTLPQWRGRVALPDPINDERTLYLLVTLTQQSEELANAYRARFGRELVLDADCPNAGYQWIKDLLTNQPLLLPGDADVASKVGDPQSGEAWIGLCSLEQFAKVSLGKLAFTPLISVTPTAGLKWPTYLGVPDRCPHPQAAKLLALWLMGDAAGKGGYTPWYEPGLYPARTDVPDPPGAVPRQELEPRLWALDYTYINTHLQAVRDHVAAHIGRPVGGR